MVELKDFLWALSRQPKVHNCCLSNILLGMAYVRLVHAFTSAGVLPSQYKRMSMFAEMGVVGRGYIDQG